MPRRTRAQAASAGVCPRGRDRCPPETAHTQQLRACSPVAIRARNENAPQSIPAGERDASAARARGFPVTPTARGRVRQRRAPPIALSTGTNAFSRTPRCGSAERPPPTRNEKPCSLWPFRTRSVAVSATSLISGYEHQLLQPVAVILNLRGRL